MIDNLRYALDDVDLIEALTNLTVDEKTIIGG